MDFEQIFDAKVELGNLKRGLDYGLSEQTWYHLVRTILNLDSAIGEIVVWTICTLSSGDGCILSGYNNEREYSIMLESREDNVQVTLMVRSGLDDPTPWQVKFSGSDLPENWARLIERVAAMEDVGVFLGNWPGEVAACGTNIGAAAATETKVQKADFR
jgi:hypothetical protein